VASQANPLQNQKSLTTRSSTGSALSVFFTLTTLLGLSVPVFAAHEGYGAALCKNRGFECVRVKKGDTWARLFPDHDERRLVRRLNRMNIEPRKGQRLAVPVDRSTSDPMDFAPFPPQIQPGKTNKVVISQKELAWGAYDSEGTLVYWGPISAGRGYCEDTGESCETPSGTFTAFRREGADCASTVYPVGEGGAPMPYCVFFNGGIALHGSSEVPGYNASHGCVRLFIEDAEWLNESFIEIGRTRVVVEEELPAERRESEAVSSGTEPDAMASWR